MSCHFLQPVTLCTPCWAPSCREMVALGSRLLPSLEIGMWGLPRPSQVEERAAGSGVLCHPSSDSTLSVSPGPVAPLRHSSCRCWCLSRPCSPCDAQPPPRGPGSPALGAEAADSWCCTHQGRQCCGSGGAGGPFHSPWYGGHSTAMGWVGRLRGTTWGCLSGASQVTQDGGISSWSHFDEGQEAPQKKQLRSRQRPWE